jgi:hypothetical protein
LETLLWFHALTSQIVLPDHVDNARNVNLPVRSVKLNKNSFFPDQGRGCSSDCASLSLPTIQRSRQRRSVIAVLREKLAEKKLVIRAKSAFSENMLFDLL